MFKKLFNFAIINRNHALKKYIKFNKSFDAKAYKVNATACRLYGSLPTRIFLHNKSAGPPVILLTGVLSFLGNNKDSDENKESELETILKRSILLIQKEEFKKAEQMLHLALRVAQDLQHKDGITYVYDVMANLAYETQELSKAETLFVTIIQRLMADGVEANDNRVLHISLKLAKIQQSYGNKSKAEEGYLFCIQNLDNRVTKEQDRTEDTVMLWAMALDYYAHFLLQENRLKEAFDCFKKAYETFTAVNGTEFEQAVVLLNDLGTVSNLLGDLDGALAYLQQAVSIGERLPEMRDLCSVYVNLGHVYFYKSMLTEAERSCTVGRRLADRYEDKETADEAEECLKEVRKTIKL